VTEPLVYFCALLSPLTSDAENQRLRQLASRGDVDWREVAVCANRAFLAPALRLAIVNKGLSTAVPPVFMSYLEEMYLLNVKRNAELTKQLLEIVRLLNGVGVTPLLLKGGAALATDLFPDPGMRFMGDLDLLLPGDTIDRSEAALKSAGYTVPDKYAAQNFDWKHHRPPLIRAGAPASVELHQRLLSRGRSILEVEAVWRNSGPHAENKLPGVTVAFMSPTDELIYCFAHSELEHRRHEFAQIDARQLHHFTYFLVRRREEIDWERIEALRQHPRYGAAFKAYEHLAKRLFRVNLPGSTEANPDALRHYRSALRYRSGWRRQAHRIQTLLSEAVSAFSSERLQLLYPREKTSINRLRIRHLKVLLGNYRRLEAWRTKIRGVSPM
jgi:hypothetical protein